MTLKEYIERLQQIMNDHPTTANMQVIYSSDDEGNSFSAVHFSPSVGYFCEAAEFTGVTHMIDSGIGDPPNAVCIN